MSSPGSRGLAAPSGYLQTASSLHAFNRYEIKYLAEERDVPRLREALAAHMAADEFSPVGGYPVTSLYYDTGTCGSTGRRSRGSVSGASCVSGSTAGRPRRPTRRRCTSRSNSGSTA